MTDPTMTTTELTQNDFYTLLGFLGTFIFIFIAIGVIWYLFQAIGIYRMAKNRNFDHKWFAWIPYLQYYLFGELINDSVWGFGGAKWILLFGPIVSSIASSYLALSNNFFVTLLLSIFLIAYYIYFESAQYRLYKAYSDHAVLFTVFSIILPFLAPIFIFALREHKYRPLEN